MRYNYRFSVLTEPKVLQYLNDHQIKYEVLHDSIVIFSVYSSERYPSGDILEIIDICRGRRPIVYPEYTKKEINSAEFLWLSGGSQIVDLYNAKEAYRFSCGSDTHSRHADHVAPFQIAKEPKGTKKGAFWFPDNSNGTGYLFTDSRVVELVAAHDLKGFGFEDVFLRDGSCSKMIYHVTSPNVLGIDSIARGYGETVEICPQCGRETICIDTSYQFHFDRRFLTVGQDLFMTEEMIGPGVGTPAYVISHRFYELLQAAGLTAKVSFEPIVLI